MAVPVPDPLLPNLSDAPSPDDTVDWILQNRRDAQSRAMQGMDADADGAARAEELSRATGTPAAIVDGNLENFEQQHKAALASGIIQHNAYLQDYINSHPLAAKVSNDDWGQLDKVSTLTQRLSAKGVLDKFFDYFGKGFSAQTPLGGTWLDAPKSLEEAQQLTAEHPGQQALKALFALGGAIPETALRAIGGFTSAAVGTGAEAFRQVSGKDISDRADEFLSTISDPGMWASLEGVGNPFSALHANLELKRQMKLAEPFVADGKMPPVGTSSLLDSIHAEQAKTDSGILDEIISEAQKSATRERSPELFANFIRQHTNARIGIDAEAIRKLYGDKVPTPDDGVLGWIPGIQEQLELAEAHGGDVEVPLADWIAKVEPETARELKESIRVRPGGMTLEEAKNLKEPELAKAEEAPAEEEGKAPASIEAEKDPTSIDAVRQGAKLENPSFAPEGFDRIRALVEDAGNIIPKDAKSGVEVKSTRATATSLASFKLKDILNDMDYSHLSSTEKLFSDFFGGQLERLVPDTPVHVVSKADMSRLLPYAPGTPGYHYLGEIILRKDMVDGTMPPWVTSHVIIHEAAHAMSVDALYNFPELKGATTQLMKETHEYLSRVDPKARKEHDYAFGDEREFLAEGFGKPAFREVLRNTPISRDMAKKFGLGTKSKSVWDAVRDIFKKLLSQLAGRPVPDTVMDAFFKIGEALENANKILEKMDQEEAGASPIQGELPGTTRMEDRDIFQKAAAIGMTTKQFRRYQELIDKRAAEDAEVSRNAALATERERQTAEWKENYAKVHGEAEKDISSRPDIAADRFLREGDLYGEKYRKPSIARDTVPDEFRGSIPKDYLSDQGLHADDLAGLFGYQSGEQLLTALSALEAERQGEGLTPKAHVSKLIDAEADRRMRRDYGNLEQNIIDEAKDNVVTQTQLDLLHEEMVALAQQGGAELTFSKEQIKRWVKDQFDKTPLSAHSSDKYLASAGRAGQKAEDALLAGDPAEAFKAKQQQYLSVLLAKEARKLEKEKVSFDKFAKRFSKREVAGVPGEYTNWIHDILMRTGNFVRRTVQDLQEGIGRETHSTLEKFTEARNADADIWAEDENMPSDFQIMPVAPFLFDQTYRKSIEEMTPGEFRAVRDSVRTIAKNGAEVNKINVGGAKAELRATVDTMVGQLATLFEGKEKQYAFGHKDAGIGHTIRTYWASLLQVESIFNRFDRGDPKGIFKKVVTEPLFEGSNGLSTLEREFSRKYKEVPKFGDLKKAVANPLFGDPMYDGEKRAMTRGNMLAVLQNVGNASQLDKLARGYGIKDPNMVMEWLFTHTTKEDWDRAQALGDLFEEAFEHSARMYHNLSGVAPEKIDLQPIQTPFGEYKGWYHPLIYDPIRPGTSKKLMGPNPLEDGSYFRVATPSGYTKRRTAYAAPIQLNFDAIPWKLRQMLNDASMRPAVTDAAKVFYDPKFQTAVTKYYGKEIKDLLIPYLKDVAGQKQFKDAAQATGTRVLDFARQNVIATLIGLNPSTVMKHGPTAAMLSMKEVGLRPFLRELTGLLSMNDELGERNWNFAMKGGTVDGRPWAGSEELQRRSRNWQETLTGSQADVFGENTLHNSVIKFGASPVALSDLLSAVPTWLAAYKDQIREGEQHGVAVQAADRAVRRAHGSSALAARPRIMRGGPLAQLATPFYTFFNEMFQRQYEMAWKAKDALRGKSRSIEEQGLYEGGKKEVGNMMGGLWAYVVFPAMVEQLVSPELTGNQSTTEKVAGWGLRTLSSSLPGIRDLVEAFIGGRDPTIGMYSTSAKMLIDMGKDIAHGQLSLGPAHAANTIKHTLTAFGALTGLTNAQEGRTAEYVYKYATGQERPRSMADVFRGLWHGTQKEQKR